MGSENRNKNSLLSSSSDNNNGSSEMKEKDKNVDGTEIVKAIAVAAGLGLAAWGISKLFGCSDNRKTMKAPGRDHRIYRDVFESDPADYFRNLRK